MSIIDWMNFQILMMKEELIAISQKNDELMRECGLVEPQPRIKR